MFRLKVDGCELQYSFQHDRDVNFVIKPNKVITDVTSCKMLINGDTLITGTAACLQGDHFNKEKGRKIALARALKEAGVARDTRVLVWEGYFDRFLREEPKANVE